MSLASASSERLWLSYLTLVPVFLAIHSCRPLGAAASGGLWGLSLQLCSAGSTSGRVEPSSLSSVLIVVVISTYSYVGARLTRRIGFSPLVLGVSWMGVELAFEPLGLRNALLSGTYDNTSLLHWVGGAFGYVLVGFIVAFVNASVLLMLSRIRLTVPRPWPPAGQTDNEALPSAQTFFAFPLLSIRPARPRAPPSPSSS